MWFTKRTTEATIIRIAWNLRDNGRTPRAERDGREAICRPKPRLSGLGGTCGTTNDRQRCRVPNEATIIRIGRNLRGDGWKSRTERAGCEAVCRPKPRL